MFEWYVYTILYILYYLYIHLFLTLLRPVVVVYILYTRNRRDLNPKSNLHIIFKWSTRIFYDIIDVRIGARANDRFFFLLLFFSVFIHINHHVRNNIHIVFPIDSYYIIICTLTIMKSFFFLWLLTSWYMRVYVVCIKVVGTVMKTMPICGHWFNILFFISPRKMLNR